MQISSKLNRDNTGIELANMDNGGPSLMFLYKAIGNQLRDRKIDMHNFTEVDIESLAERFVQSAEMLARPGI